MAHPRQQQSSTADLRDYSGRQSAAPGRFAAKKRAPAGVAGSSEERSVPTLHHSESELLELWGHRFRTPLQAIFGYTELLEREIHGPLTDAQRCDLRGIQQSQQLLLGLINAFESSRPK